MPGSRLLRFSSAYSGLPQADRGRPGGDQMSPLRRLSLVPLIALAITGFIGPHVNPQNLTAPVFDTFRQVMPMTSWANLFALVALLGIVALVTARPVPYVLANAGLLFLATVWVSVLGYGRFINGIGVSDLAFGLWFYPLFHSVISLAIPITVFRPPTPTR